MPSIKDEEHRELAAAFAEQWGVDPGDILWEGALHFKQLVPTAVSTAPEFVWVYQEIQRDAEGSTLRDVDGPLFVKRQRPIPEEWIEEYEAAVKDLYT
jgi:hypothetical protein